MPKRREIIIANIFFSDLPQSKLRPAIILSNEQYNLRTGFVLAAIVTSSPDEFCLMLQD